MENRGFDRGTGGGSIEFDASREGLHAERRPRHSKRTPSNELLRSSGTPRETPFSVPLERPGALRQGVPAVKRGSLVAGAVSSLRRPSLQFHSILVRPRQRIPSLQPRT